MADSAEAARVEAGSLVVATESEATAVVEREVAERAVVAMVGVGMVAAVRVVVRTNAFCSCTVVS